MITEFVSTSATCSGSKHPESPTYASIWNCQPSHIELFGFAHEPPVESALFDSSLVPTADTAGTPRTQFVIGEDRHTMWGFCPPNETEDDFGMPLCFGHERAKASSKVQRSHDTDE